MTDLSVTPAAAAPKPAKSIFAGGEAMRRRHAAEKRFRFYTINR